MTEEAGGPAAAARSGHTRPVVSPPAIQLCHGAEDFPILAPHQNHLGRFSKGLKPEPHSKPRESALLEMSQDVEPCKALEGGQSGS